MPDHYPMPMVPIYQYPYAQPGPRPPAGDGPVTRMQHAVVPMQPPPPMLMGALGQPAPASMLRDDPSFANFDKVPAFYTVTVQLGGNVGDTQGNSTPLRPESFICERITWACTEVPSDYATGVALAGSPQGRSVTVTWGDEFTRFLGKDPCLLSALFGDSNGFLDLPRGILFQGRQTLSVLLTRLLDPTGNNLAKRFDFNFQGVGLFPKGVSASGSAG